MIHDHLELEELLAAYALDAVDPDEDRRIERHLRKCAACQGELPTYHEVASLLVPDEPAPDDVWDGIAAALEETPPPLELAPVVPLARRPSRSLRLLTGLTAVAAVAIAVLGVRVISQDHRLNRMQAAMAHDDLQRAALAALANPTATTVELRATQGSATARAAVLPDGRGYLLTDGLPRLPVGRTYQLWALMDGQRISAGTLGLEAKAAAFHVSGPIGGFAVTDEQAPGVVASKNPAVLIGWLQPA